MVDQTPSSSDATSVAAAAFGWIDSAGVGVGVDVDVDAGSGRTWYEPGTVLEDLYSGTAGVLLGCAEGHAAGLDLSRVAADARDRLIGLSGEPAGEYLDGDGLFIGWSGVAVAFAPGRAWLTTPMQVPRRPR